jgi:hypothetical protein
VLKNTTQEGLAGANTLAYWAHSKDAKKKSDVNLTLTGYLKNYNQNKEIGSLT